MDLKSLIRDIPDFPKEGILFKDITPLLADTEGLQFTVDKLTGFAHEQKAEAIAGIESRGFLFGVPVAMALGVPFVPIRKPGKLPAETTRVEYELEYGTDALEIHTDAVSKGQRVVVIDDLLATGGTAAATAELLKRVGAVPAGFGFLIELSFLPGRSQLGDVPTQALLTY